MATSSSPAISTTTTDANSAWEQTPSHGAKTRLTHSFRPEPPNATTDSRQAPQQRATAINMTDLAGEDARGACGRRLPSTLFEKETAGLRLNANQRGIHGEGCS